MTNEEAAVWFEARLKNIAMPVAREMHKMAISALRAQNSSEKPNNWISVEDRLPEPGTNILVANAKTGSQYVSHRDLIWFSPERKAYVPTSYLEEFEFTHWMPLPEPPEVILP